MHRILPFIAAPVLACCLVAGTAAASPITVSFGNYSGAGYSVGTTQTLTNIDPLQEFKMTVLQGSYEITVAPYNELNLKDESGKGAPRSVQFTLKNGAAFDFTGVKVNDGYGNATFSSNNGGSQALSPSSRTTTFSGPQWDNITELTITETQLYGEFKMPSLTFNDTPTKPTTVPEPVSLMLLGTSVLGTLLMRRRTAA